ncbi:MAG TPA: PEP-CTERM sorting domain-containing protein, partial [Thermoguttaceae bacterium]
HFQSLSTNDMAQSNQPYMLVTDLGLGTPTEVNVSLAEGQDSVAEPANLRLMKMDIYGNNRGTHSLVNIPLSKTKSNQAASSASTTANWNLAISNQSNINVYNIKVDKSVSGSNGSTGSSGSTSSGTINVSGAGTLTVGGAIGSGTLTINGAGTNGTVSLGAISGSGTLSIDGTTQAGTSTPVLVDQGTLTIGSGSILHINNPIIDSGLTTMSTGQLTLNDPSIYTGSTAISGCTVVSGNGTLTVNGGIMPVIAGSVIQGTITVVGGSQIILVPPTNGGSLGNVGNGIVTLTNTPPADTGCVIVSGGTLNVDTTSQIIIPDSTAPTTISDGTLELGSITGAGTLSITDGSSALVVGESVVEGSLTIGPGSVLVIDPPMVQTPVNETISPVPEPSTLVLLTIAMLWLIGVTRRRV